MPLIETWLAKMGLGWQIVTAVLATIVLILIFPDHNSDSITAISVLGSAGVGIALERRYVGFEAAGPLAQKALRFALGAVVVLILRFGLSAAFNGLQPELTFRFIRYTIIGLWFVLGVPWVFVKLKLAGAVEH